MEKVEDLYRSFGVPPRRNEAAQNRLSDKNAKRGVTSSA
jgi:hypothetical protein